MGSRSFSLRGSLLERSALGAPPLVLVLLREHGLSLTVLDDRHGEPDEPGRIAAPRASIVARFGLTPRQTEVALLLARRKTNDEIAEALGISPHTARHHTQRVLRKMNVHSRREIASRLTEGSSDPRRGEG